MESSVFDQIFRNDEGNIVIAQSPNLPIVTWAVASLLELIFPTGRIHAGLELLAFGALFTWAWLELFDGVNYFRRVLGLGVLVGMLAWKVYSIAV